ncbi:signal peptidase I [Natrinema amylolyticum]|uniref:signal peptidase I n=1 Tax=Natrinema amylolyticum TaxID=2878679 RepID=UPI001CF94BEA|nr:signal peptidase I [Natrinema amylolyticum]
MRYRAGVALLAGVIAVSALTPLGVSFVYSDSMEPTIDTGDGFVVLPANDAAAGDVVTFYSDERDEYVTHRVVEETEVGYVTQGDNNQETDQAVGYSHVSPDDIEGRVLSVGESPLTAPALGTLVSESSQHRGILVLIGVVALTVSIGSNGRSRDVINTGSLFRQLILTSIAIGVVAIVISGSTVGLTITEAASSSPETMTFEDGDRTTLEFTNTPTPYTHRVTSASGLRIVDTIVAEETLSLTVEHVGDSESAAVQFYNYPAVVPKGIVETLHGIHPLLAAVFTVGAAHLPIVGVYWLLVDSSEPVRTARIQLPRRLR